MAMRESNLVIRLSADELNMMHAVAKHQDRTVSGVVRTWIRERYERIWGDTPAPHVERKHGPRVKP